jgi:hypothetical protein
MSTTLIPSRTDDAVTFLTERAQASIDEAADAEYERREALERAVTFSDLLEELTTTVSAEDGAEFMECMADPHRHNLAQMYMTLDKAKERVIERRLAQGD